MESLGEKLKNARENKGYTYDQIGRDTNIARRYLEALETEDFSQFPGEPYLLGFLRNYAEYLGLDVQELLSLYRAHKIQEQPVPVDQLLRDTRKFPLIPVLLSVIAVAALALTLYFVLNRPGKEAVATEEVRQNVEYVLEEGLLEKRLYAGDSVRVALGEEQYKVELNNLGESALLSAPGGDLVLELGQDVSVDLDGDGLIDMSIFVADLFKNNPEQGVMLRFELLDAMRAGTPDSGVDPIAEIVSAAENPEALRAPVLISSPNPFPFTMQATFKGFCMFRWESDKKEREERYFHKAEVLNVQAQNGIRLWVSNASAVKLQVIGGGRTVDVEIGGPGEVVVSDLRWVKDEDGRFILTTVRLD